MAYRRRAPLRRGFLRVGRLLGLAKGSNGVPGKANRRAIPRAGRSPPDVVSRSALVRILRERPDAIQKHRHATTTSLGQSRQGLIKAQAGPVRKRLLLGDGLDPDLNEANVLSDRDH